MKKTSNRSSSFRDPRLQAVAEALHGIGAVQFGSFTLASGKPSSYYLDFRLVPSYPNAYAMTLAAYTETLESLGGPGFDAIAGVATAGVTFSSPLAIGLRKPMVYVRSRDKGHGLGQLVEGRVPAGSKVVVIDDLVTTGGSILAAAAALRKLGYKVDDAVVLVDRLEGGASNLRAAGIKLTSFCSIIDLVRALSESGRISGREAKAICSQAKLTGGPGGGNA